MHFGFDCGESREGVSVMIMVPLRSARTRTKTAPERHAREASDEGCYGVRSATADNAHRRARRLAERISGF